MKHSPRRNGTKFIAKARLAVTRALRRWQRQLVLAAGIAVVAYMLILAATQWFHLQSNLAEDIFAEDRGGGAAQHTEELHPRDPVTLNKGDGPVHLTFVIDEMDLKDQTIRGRVSGSIDSEQYQKDNPGARPPDHINLSITGQFATESVRIPLSQDPGVLTSTVPVSFEAWGYTQDFPSDAYGSNNFLGIGSFLGFPDVEVASSGGMTPYVVTTAGDYTYLNFLVERKHGQRWWVYTITLIPAALIVALALGQRRIRASKVTMGLEAAIGVLAVLPLREVLVPPDLPSLTRVDVLLGLQLITFLGVAVFSVFRRESPAKGSGLGWPSDSTTPRSGQG